MARDYHRQIGFPDVDKPTGTFEVSPTSHAREESNNDRYGGFKLPTRVKLTDAMYDRDPQDVTGTETGETTLPHIFEITVENGKVVKLGARTEYDDERDIVLILDPHAGILITAWINVKGDYHATSTATSTPRRRRSARPRRGILYLKVGVRARPHAGVFYT